MGIELFKEHILTLAEAARRIPADSPSALAAWITATINATGLLQVEYVEFADEVSLAHADSWSDYRKIRCFIAVRCFVCVFDQAPNACQKSP